jgi:hypothetical protein
VTSIKAGGVAAGAVATATVALAAARLFVVWIVSKEKVETKRNA